MCAQDVLRPVRSGDNCGYIMTDQPSTFALVFAPRSVAGEEVFAMDYRAQQRDGRGHLQRSLVLFGGCAIWIDVLAVAEPILAGTCFSLCAVFGVAEFQRALLCWRAFEAERARLAAHQRRTWLMRKVGS